MLSERFFWFCSLLCYKINSLFFLKHVLQIQFRISGCILFSSVELCRQCEKHN